MKSILLFVIMVSGGLIVQGYQQGGIKPEQEAGVQIVQGQLYKIDPEKQLIWIRTPDSRELQFTYNGDTVVEGEDKTVEALTGTGQKELKVYFRVMAGVNTAVKIEILPVSAQLRLFPDSVSVHSPAIMRRL